MSLAKWDKANLTGGWWRVRGCCFCEDIWNICLRSIVLWNGFDLIWNCLFIYFVYSRFIWHILSSASPTIWVHSWLTWSHFPVVSIVVCKSGHTETSQKTFRIIHFDLILRPFEHGTGYIKCECNWHGIGLLMSSCVANMRWKRFMAMANSLKPFQALKRRTRCWRLSPTERTGSYSHDRPLKDFNGSECQPQSLHTTF